MFRRSVSIGFLLLLAMGVLASAFSILPVRAAGAIYISADGSISPSTAPISTIDNITYTLTGDIYSSSIVIQRDGITVDGNGYTIMGTIPGNGMDLSNRNNVTVENMHIIDFGGAGIYLYLSSDSTLSGNNVEANGWGIYLNSSSYNTLSGNILLSNSYAGIKLYSSSNNTLAGNGASANGMAGAAGIILSSSSYNTLSGNGVGSNYKGGIELASSLHNTLSGNRASDNDGYNIFLFSSSDNTLSGNNAAGNNDGYCIYLSSSINNTLSGNKVGQSIQDSIYLYASSYNTLLGNNANGGVCGIELSSSGDSIVSNNNITNNGCGIILGISSNNAIYHNNFIKNTEQAISNGANKWNNGYPSGGNYWSDYNGTDFQCGAYQNVTGSDGIGDTGYIIGASNTDNFPLMKPWAPLTLNITASRTIVGQGYGVLLNFAIVDPGSFGENLNITFFCNETVIGREINAYVSAGNILSFTQVWNTSSFAYSNCTISVIVSVVSNQIHTQFFAVSVNGIFVTIPGDTNGDHKVNVLDLIIIAIHLGNLNGGGYPIYSPRWYQSMNCDLNNDGKVNVLDLIICANHMVQHW